MENIIILFYKLNEGGVGWGKENIGVGGGSKAAGRAGVWLVSSISPKSYLRNINNIF